MWGVASVSVLSVRRSRWRMSDVGCGRVCPLVRWRYCDVTHGEDMDFWDSSLFFTLEFSTCLLLPCCRINWTYFLFFTSLRLCKRILTNGFERRISFMFYHRTIDEWSHLDDLRLPRECDEISARWSIYSVLTTLKTRAAAAGVCRSTWWRGWTLLRNRSCNSKIRLHFLIVHRAMSRLVLRVARAALVNDHLILYSCPPNSPCNQHFPK